MTVVNENSDGATGLLFLRKAAVQTQEEGASFSSGCWSLRMKTWGFPSHLSLPGKPLSAIVGEQDAKQRQVRPINEES